MSRTTTSTHEGFTAEERAAMKAHSEELRKSARRTSRAEKAAADEQDVLDKIAEMSDADRVIAERVHAIVRATAPMLAPRTWYGQPAYALDGAIVCFFQPAAKFRTRYATLGFNDKAVLDDGAMWPVAFALTSMTPEVEARVTELVRRAVD